jgi:hypothetical protein
MPGTKNRNASGNKKLYKKIIWKDAQSYVFFNLQFENKSHLRTPNLESAAARETKKELRAA